MAEVATVSDGTRQVFIKAFPERFQKNGLLNELVGYLVAKAAGLPVAQRAFVLVLPTEQLFKVHPNHKAVLSTGTGLSIAWATTAINGPPLRVLRSTRDTEMQQRLKRWRLLPRVLAFDDLVANEDRTDDNIIVVSNGAFAMVDHAEIAGGISRLHGFDAATQTKNKLIDEIFGRSVPMSIKSGMMLAAEEHVTIVQRAQGEIRRWIDFLSSGQQTVDHPIVQFLVERARMSPDRIRSQQGLLV